MEITRRMIWWFYGRLKDYKSAPARDEAELLRAQFSRIFMRARSGYFTLDGLTPVQRSRVDSALLKALARGFRWQKMLQEGDYQTIEEIANAENINPSYVSRVLRMTLLAPEIVEAILAGRQPEELTMASAMLPFPMEWEQQRIVFRLTTEFSAAAPH